MKSRISAAAQRVAGAAILIVLSAAAIAAPTANTIDGVAKDALQRPLPDVQLRLETPDGRVVARTASDKAGLYHFTGVAPGIYSVIGEKANFATSTGIVTVEAGAGATADLTLAAQQALDLAVAAQRLEEARIGIQPRTGASTYRLTDDAIASQPGGEENNLNKVLLQAPGVTQDSLASGSLHVRNEHGLLQYRINGVILPEGVSFFGQSLSPRFASSVDLITGALPAEYGNRTSGIIDIQTKSGAFQPGGSISLYGGSNGTFQSSVDYAGSVGHYNYYVAGDYLRSDLGIENPTPGYHAIHDSAEQGHGFAYLEDVIDATSKVSAILGTYRGQFQIPNNPNQAPGFTANGIANFDSAKLDENQREINDYGILSYLKSGQDVDFQISGFSRYSSLSFQPDALGDLIFDGVSQQAYRRSIGNGIQAEAAYKAITDHTIRSGLVVTAERAVSTTNSTVLPTDATGAELAPPLDTPFSITDNSAKTGWQYGAYLQDEWRVTPTVTLNYGGRFDLVDAYTHESQFSPRVNAVWKATPTTTIHAGYANYFTPPPLELVAGTSIDRFAGTTAAPATSQNSAVKAERSHYFDVGIEQVVMPGLKVGVDAYYKYARNLIDEGQFGAPIILTAFNYHIGQNRGVEFTTSYEKDNLSLYANLAIAEQKAEGISSAQFNFDPDELAYISSHAISTDHTQSVTGSAGASYLWHGTRFSTDMLAGTGVRAGFANGSSVGSYTQFNFGVSHRFDAAPGGPLEGRVDLINAFDTIYLLRSGTGVGVGAPQYGPRRTVFAGVRKEF